MVSFIAVVKPPMTNRILQVLLVLSIALVLIFVVTPKIIGLGIRDATPSLINLVPPESQGQVSVTNTQFDIGWFRTAATIDIDFTSPGLGESLDIRLNFDIQHGPLFLTDEGLRIGLVYANIDPRFSSSELTQALTQIPFELPSVEIALFAGLDQSLRVDLDVAPVNHNQNGINFIFTGIDGDLTANADNSASLNVSVGNIIVHNSNSQFSFNLEFMKIVIIKSLIIDLLAPSCIFQSIPSIS